MVSTKALPEDLNLKFRLKLNHGCFHCAILKGLHGVKEKRAHKVRDGHFFFFQNIQMTFLRFWKCLKTTWNSPEQPAELTQKWTTETTTPHSWYSYVVAIVGNYYGVTIEVI